MCTWGHIFRYRVRGVLLRSLSILYWRTHSIQENTFSWIEGAWRPAAVSVYPILKNTFYSREHILLNRGCVASCCGLCLSKSGILYKKSEIPRTLVWQLETTFFVLGKRTRPILKNTFYSREHILRRDTAHGRWAAWGPVACRYRAWPNIALRVRSRAPWPIDDVCVCVCVRERERERESKR